MKLHYFPTSHWSRVVSLAVAELGLDCERAMVDITTNANFEPDYLRINPRGVVPTLEDDGVVVWDSREIVRHLDEHHGGGRLITNHDEATHQWILDLHDLPLMLFSYSVWIRGERGERSKDILADKIERAKAYAERHPELAERYLRKASFFTAFSGRVHDEGHVAAELERVRGQLDELGARVAERAWIGGDAVSFADCIAASVLARLVDLRLLHEWYDRPGDPLRAYYDRLRGWPAFRFVFFDDPNIAERLRLRDGD